MPKLRVVIESMQARGAGTPEDCCRTVVSYHDVNGDLLAENDPVLFTDAEIKAVIEELSGRWDRVDLATVQLAVRMLKALRLRASHR